MDGNTMKKILGGFLFLILVIAIPVQSLPTGSTTTTAPSLKDESPARFTQDIHWTMNGIPGNNGWYRSPLTLTCTWDNQTITAVYYRILELNWTRYTSPITISQQGNISFAWKGVDWNGSDTEPGSTAFHIDYTPPTANCVHDRNKVIVTAYDNGSSIDRIEFWIGPYLQFVDTFPGPDGNWTAVWIIRPIPHINVTITIIVYDLAGNKYYYNYTVTNLNLPQLTTLQRLSPHLHSALMRKAVLLRDFE